MDPFLVAVIGWIVVGIPLFLHFKDSFAALVAEKSNLPRAANYLLILLPLILVEEWLTWDRNVAGNTFGKTITVTLPAFYVLFIALYLAQTRLKLSFKKAMLLTFAVGWFNEMILVGRLASLLGSGQVLAAVLFSVLGPLFYVGIAVLPAGYVAREMEKQKAAS